MFTNKFAFALLPFLIACGLPAEVDAKLKVGPGYRLVRLKTVHIKNASNEHLMVEVKRGASSWETATPDGRAVFVPIGKSLDVPIRAEGAPEQLWVRYAKGDNWSKPQIMHEVNDYIYLR